MVRKLARTEELNGREDRLLLAREELFARLTAELRPERLSILSRGELAKVVDAAVQAHFARNGVDADPIARRDLITALLKALLDPNKPLPVADEGGSRRSSNRSAVEAAKAQIQPLVLEHMDVAAAADMPRAVFEAQLSGWVKDLLTETKIQLNFAEQRELVDSLIADMLGLGPLKPLIDTAAWESKGSQKVKERLEARISSEQKALFKRAAELQGRTLSDFVIASAYDAAVRTIQEMEVIRLSAADSRAFAEALLNPRQPPAELQAAAQRYRKMVAQ